MMKVTAKPLLGQCAADIMSQHIVMIPREMSLQGAARMLARAGVTGAPVVDDRGRCIGVLSTTDFMHWVENDHKPAKAEATDERMCMGWELPEAVETNCRVEDCMTRDPVLVVAGTRIGALARMMIDAHIHRVIVVDAVSQRPIGIVSTIDILAAVARADQVEPEMRSGAALHDTIH
jgi:predicted transcriptional regulator